VDNPAGREPGHRCLVAEGGCRNGWILVFAGKAPTGPRTARTRSGRQQRPRVAGPPSSVPRVLRRGT